MTIHKKSGFDCCSMMILTKMYLQLVKETCGSQVLDYKDK